MNETIEELKEMIVFLEKRLEYEEIIKNKTQDLLGVIIRSINLTEQAKKICEDNLLKAYEERMG